MEDVGSQKHGSKKASKKMRFIEPHFLCLKFIEALLKASFEMTTSGSEL